MNAVRLTLAVLDGSYTVCRLEPESGIPHWVPETGFISVTRTNEELSVVCPSDVVPHTVEVERDFHVRPDIELLAPGSYMSIDRTTSIQVTIEIEPNEDTTLVTLPVGIRGPTERFSLEEAYNTVQRSTKRS